MTQAYVVTEGKSDAEILKRLLPEAIVANTEFVAASGRYGAQSLASTILAVKRRPVALVVDADTEDQFLVREREEFSRELLRQTASGVPFAVFTAVPELEAVFFQDKSVLERLTDQKLEDGEWTIAKHHPKESLTAVLGERSLAVQTMLDDLPEGIIRVLQQHTLVSALAQFLSSTAGERD